MGCSQFVDKIRNLLKATIGKCFHGNVKSAWLATTIPLAEFLLLLTTLLIYIEVAPSDIPKRCGYDLQRNCLGVFGQNNGEFDSLFAEMPCGSLRVMCWRSGLKYMMYEGHDAPDHTYYFEDFNNQLKEFGLDTYIPMAEMCQCMMTNNGTQSFPKSPDTFRSATDYFCTELKAANHEIGIGGLVLAAIIVSVKAYLEELNEDDSIDIHATWSSLIVLTVAIGWLGWSIGIVVQTRNYALPSAASEADCEIPAGNIFFYIFCLGLASIFGATYSLWISLRVLMSSKELQADGLERRETRSRMQREMGGPVTRRDLDMKHQKEHGF